MVSSDCALPTATARLDRSAWWVPTHALADTFKFSTDPELEAKIIDVVGLYLAPPDHAVVLCVDEKSQIQALDRTQKVRFPPDRGGIRYKE